MALTFKITPAEVAEAYQRKIGWLQEGIDTREAKLSEPESGSAFGADQRRQCAYQIDELKTRIVSYHYLVDHLHYDLPHYSLTLCELRDLSLIATVE
jgi:hypothetical protein